MRHDAIPVRRTLDSNAAVVVVVDLSPAGSPVPHVPRETTAPDLIRMPAQRPRPSAGRRRGSHRSRVTQWRRQGGPGLLCGALPVSAPPATPANPKVTPELHLELAKCNSQKCLLTWGNAKKFH